MPIEVNLAKLSPTMENGQLVKWLVQVGDKVKEGDTLAEIQTDKAVMPMESFEEGTVALLDVQEGDEIALGQRVLVLAGKGEDPKTIAASLGGAPAPAAKSAEPAVAPTMEPAAEKPGETPIATASPAEPEPKIEAQSAGSEREVTNTPPHPARSPSGNGQGGQPAPTPASEPEPEPEAVAAGGRVKASPLARKIAQAEGVDLAQVPGSGPGGRVVRSDVEEFVAARASAPPPAAAKPQAAPRPAAPAAAPARTPAAERIPHSRMRKTIAQRMLQAKQTAPEIHVTVDIRIDRLVEARERLNQQLAAEKIKLSVGDFVTKAVALALRRHPALNASYEPEAIVRHGEVNIGIAVALEGGLMVPVLHRADTLGLRAIRSGTEAIVNATRQGKLTTQQMTGGTFTISNLGMYGVRAFDAILNLPEVGILAVGAAEKRPVVEGDRLVVGTMMTATLTADHRAVDGATAAEFLRTVKGLLEEPASMLL
ncbi:MAG TPA: dihydrolipoamide acetyltransferase family protein [Isosphaeraceae bacterium]